MSTNTLAEMIAVRADAIVTMAVARLAKNRSAEVDAAETRIRTERRIGELVIEVKQSTGLNAGTRSQLAGRARLQPTQDERPTLAGLGIDKKLSAHAQRLAAIPPEDFERQMARWRERMQVGARVSLDISRCRSDEAMDSYRHVLSHMD
jgi:hypothetical protein